MRCNHNRSKLPMPGALTRTALVLALVALSNAAWAASPPAQDLLEKFRCTTCHMEREVGAGPAWADIANYYRGKPEASKLVADKIRLGSKSGGPWHMPPHPEVSNADAATMARYILAVKN